MKLKEIYIYIYIYNTRDIFDRVLVPIRYNYSKVTILTLRPQRAPPVVHSITCIQKCYRSPDINYPYK